MEKLTERAKFVKWMRNHAKVLQKDIEDWPEDYEVDSCAYLLEWAAEIIVRYAPQNLPPKNPRKTKKTPNVQVTGAARLHRAASRERSERGRA